MIVDIHDRWVIVTPTKTGTTSLTALLTKRVRSCGVHTLPKHGPQAPDKPTIRILTVRHPLDRLCSMYYHLQREGGRGRSYALESFDSFVEQLLERSHSPAWDEWSLWSWPLSRYVKAANINLCFDVCVDGGQALADYLVTTYGYSIPTMAHLRKSKDRAGWSETIDRLRPDLLAGALEWAEPDFQLFVENAPLGYSKREN